MQPRTVREGLQTERKPRPFLISSLLPIGGLLTIHGAPKSLKSMITKNAIMQAGDGLPVLDERFKCSAGKIRTLYVEMEHGEENLLQSFGKIQGHRNYFDSPDNVRYVSRDWGLRLNTEEGMKRLKDYVNAAEPDLLVLDPWSEFHNYTDTQNTEQLALLRAIRSLRKGLAVWVVHHDCKPGEFRRAGDPTAMRGSALHQASDSVLSAQRRTGVHSDVVRVSFTLRYDDAPHPLEWVYDKSTDTLEAA